MSHRRWTPEDVEKLKKMAKKHRREDIAAYFGRSVSSTQVKAHKLGISLRVQRGESETVA
jgi:hypothetical protein